MNEIPASNRGVKSREHLPCHRRFPKDMLHESMTMDMRDYGAYCIVLDLIYQYGGAVPDDASLISRYMRGCNAMGWKNIRSRLLGSGHIYQDGDSLRSLRADAELKEAGRIREANAMGGHLAQIRARSKKLRHPPDRPSDPPGHPPSHLPKLKTKTAENNGLGLVHLSYPHTQPHPDIEGKKEAAPPPPPSFENDAVVAERKKGVGEEASDPPAWTTPSLVEIEYTPELRKLYQRAEEVYTPGPVPQRYWRKKKQSREELDAEMAARGMDISASRRRREASGFQGYVQLNDRHSA
jgi:uncharacterized protein YdaU (DUF1376 family)